ncbi:MAG: siderophore-interacting protein [Propionicimonas sp.]
MAEATTLRKGVQGVIMRAYRARDYEITVTGARDLGLHYRRLSFHAPELLAAHPPYPTMWIRLWCPGPDRLYQRAFTLVDPDPGAGTFDLEFAMHEQGYAMDFARNASEGDVVQVSVLTRDDYQPPEVMPPGFVMVADPASLPAVNSVLAGLPEEVRVRLWFGQQHAEDRELPIRQHPGLAVTWVPHHELATRLRDEVSEVSGWYGWVCVDTAQTRAIKEILRAATGAGKRDGHAMGYWTRGRTTG